MSAVAANNPYAWRPQFQTAQDIATVAQNNRYIGYPYTRAMNPILEVDMAAAVIMTTVGKARELGIEPERWIYLRGGADVNDIWYVSERPEPAPLARDQRGVEVGVSAGRYRAG